jgi:hypothetical protein
VQLQQTLEVSEKLESALGTAQTRDANLKAVDATFHSIGGRSSRNFSADNLSCQQPLNVGVCPQATKC